MSAPGVRSVRTTTILSTSWPPQPTPKPGVMSLTGQVLRTWVAVSLPSHASKAPEVQPVPEIAVEGDWFDPVTRARLNAAAIERGVEVPLR